MGDDSESGLYSPGDEAPAGSENSQRVLDGSSQLGYRCGAPLTLLHRVNVFYFYVLTLEHHTRLLDTSVCPRSLLTAVCGALFE